MYPRHRLDIRPADVAYGLGACLLVRNAERSSAALLRRGGLTGHGLVTFSVRSAWDLLLSALDLPAGDDVLVSAITHPEMITIIEAHGPRAVALDLDPKTLTPTRAELRRACTRRGASSGRSSTLVVTGTSPRSVQPRSMHTGLSARAASAIARHESGCALGSSATMKVVGSLASGSGTDPV